MFSISPVINFDVLHLLKAGSGLKSYTYFKSYTYSVYGEDCTFRAIDIFLGKIIDGC